MKISQSAREEKEKREVINLSRYYKNNNYKKKKKFKIFIFMAIYF